MKKFFRTAVCVIICIMLTVSVLSACSGTTGMADTGSVIINEVMSSNSAFAPAGDGKYYDWIELYNPTGETVDLNECYITDNDSIPLRFQLQGLSLEPGRYALVYLSGLNGIDANGYLHANFKLSSRGETITLNDKYGNVISRVEVGASPTNVSYGRLDENGSASYVWFSTPTPLARNEGSWSTDPNKLELTGNGVIINEFMIDNTYILYDADGDYGDWVELYNPTDTDANMSGYSLSDSSKNPSKWVFPYGTVIPAGEYLVVFCDGKDTTDSAGMLHTNFSLSSQDDAITLFSNQGAICSSHSIPDMPSNISCGYPVGGENGELKLFARPTPGKANDTGSFELTSTPVPDVNNGVLISEVLSVSGSKSEYSCDFIEIFNATSEDVDLGGYTIAQTPGEVVFTFPEMTLRAGCCTLVYCDGYNRSEAGKALHAAIKINSGGEEFYLAEPDGRICDHFSSGKGTNGVSSGRIGSDVTTRYFFTTPTPGKPNGTEGATGYAPMPEFSLNGGYVQSGTQVSITIPEGCEVVYTTDGSAPKSSSDKYTQPISITETTVIRAAAISNGKLMSQCVTQTYLVEEQHTVPVVSLSSAPSGLLGEKNGILINYKNGLERNVHIEYFDEDGTKCVEFDAGASIFGQYSRSLDQKGLRLALREVYGMTEITYDFFPDSISGINTFSNLLLRPSGQDQTRAKLRDELVPAIVRGQMDIDFQEYRACVLYINGEYWGLYYLRERLDADYIERKYGYEEGSFDLIKSQIFATEGTLDAWIELDEFCRTHDLTIQKNYEYVLSQVDTESLINYWVVETFFANPDTGNIRCYKTEDGKWRWMIYDFDWAMTSSTWKNDYIYRHLLDPTGHGAADFSNALIRKLLKNDEFRDQFISTYCYHLNNTFNTERTLAILDEMADVIDEEIARHGERWGYPNESSWETSLNMLTKFFEQKPDLALKQLQNNFDLSDREIERYMKENR